MQRKLASSFSWMLSVDDRQEMINRHSFCLSGLRRANEEAKSLRRENETLRLINVELGKKIGLLIESTLALPKSISVRTDDTFHSVKEKAGPKQGSVKTEMCNKWEETGNCPYGKQCRFAHGVNELRSVVRHFRYKTQLCRFLISGHPCPYGRRCHFLHSSST